MGLNDEVKGMLGMVRAKSFYVTAGRGVYIGKHCDLKGKHHITLGDSVTVRPYAQIWAGGGNSKNRQRLRNWRAVQDFHCQFSGNRRESTPFTECVYNGL